MKKAIFLFIAMGIVCSSTAMDKPKKRRKPITTAYQAPWYQDPVKAAGAGALGAHTLWNLRTQFDPQLAYARAATILPAAQRFASNLGSATMQGLQTGGNILSTVGTVFVPQQIDQLIASLPYLATLSPDARARALGAMLLAMPATYFRETLIDKLPIHDETKQYLHDLLRTGKSTENKLAAEAAQKAEETKKKERSEKREKKIARQVEKKLEAQKEQDDKNLQKRFDALSKPSKQGKKETTKF